ncbi:MAG: PH domain-containing protein [Lachnospiraceae bacterium]|nr:PH domain-containing protein [Lachnospiraceae bacterium]
MTDLQGYAANENVRWTGKPKRSCFLLECVFNRLLIFALIWAVLDLILTSWIKMTRSNAFLSPVSREISVEGFESFFSIYILIHLMPVWIYLAGVLLSFLHWRNIEYAITDRGIYFCSGTFAKQVNFKSFAEISFINVRRGIIDQMTGCGSISVHCGYGVTDATPNKDREGFSIRGITDYRNVFTLIRQMQNDIYADNLINDPFRRGTSVDDRAQ